MKVYVHYNKLDLIFIRCNDSLTPLLNQFDGVFMNPNDINEYYFSMPMENGRVVDLNLPQTVTFS